MTENGSRLAGASAEIGASAAAVPAEYNVDHHRVLLGLGETTWQRAVEAIRSLTPLLPGSVVVIGNGPGGLPIILGNDPTAPAVAPGSTDTRPEVTGLDQLRARADKPAVAEGDTVGQSLSARDPRASGR